jgi:DNA-binding transcriptional ArsR family regulator
MTPGEPLDIVALGAALACPTRVQMLATISENPKSVGELAHLVGVRQPTASFHVGRLLEAGLVIVEVVGTRRVVSLRAKELRLVLRRVMPAKR